MNASKISVIIPVYNTAEYLPRCLDSILNNTYQDLEIVCINDGSPDNALDVLESYAARDSRVRVIDQKNAGVSAARNRGLDEATGEYVAFVDSDDWVHRRYFEYLLQSLQQSDSDIQICGNVEISEVAADRDIVTADLDIVSLRELHILENSLNVWRRLYRRAIIGDVRFRREIRFAEDRVFNMEIYSSAKEVRVTLIKAPMYYYYMRPGSAVHSLHPREVKPLVLWYKDHLNEASCDEVHEYYLIDAAKKLLSWRYSILFCPESGEKQLVDELICFFKSRIWRGRSVGIKRKLLYMVLLQLPITYRLFRILNDPTMLGWEKQQRQKAKEAKQQ